MALHVGRDVRIEVERHRDVGVTELLLHDVSERCAAASHGHRTDGHMLGSAERHEPGKTKTCAAARDFRLKHLHLTSGSA